MVMMERIYVDDNIYYDRPIYTDFPNMDPTTGIIYQTFEGFIVDSIRLQLSVIKPEVVISDDKSIVSYVDLMYDIEGVTPENYRDDEEEEAEWEFVSNNDDYYRVAI